MTAETQSLIPTWHMSSGRIQGLAMLIIADGFAAMSKTRTKLISDYIAMIQSAAPLKTFNALRIFLATSEAAKTPLIDMIQSAGITVVADTIDSVWHTTTPTAYTNYLKTLYDRGINLFCIDDCHRYSVAQIKAMTAPLMALPDSTVILSSGATKDPLTKSARAAALLQLPLEVQLYVSPDETGFVRTWTNDTGMAIGAIGCYSSALGKPLPNLATLQAIFTNLNPAIPNLSVFGHNEYTDFRKLGNKPQWKALCQLIDAWHKRDLTVKSDQ